jgi:hypothetical protein
VVIVLVRVINTRIGLEKGNQKYQDRYQDSQKYPSSLYHPHKDAEE